MGKFIAKRLLAMIPVLIGITFIIYTILALTPGDPAVAILGETATQEQIEELREEMGLNDFFVIRYFKYIFNAVRGDFGTSYRTGLSVVSELMARLPYTFILAFFGVGLATIIGVPIGIVSAVKQYTLTDNVVTAVAMIMCSVPPFWLSLMLMMLFSLKLGWFPSIGVDSWRNFVIPIVAMAIGNMATMIRMTRSMMLEVIREDYIRTARAKGASERTIILKHALRNAILPVVTQVGISFGFQLGGAMVCETVFSIPGLGNMIITAVRQKDIPMVMGAIIFVAAAISLVNLLMDVVYVWIDPRLKTSKQSA
ncbi:MAG: ABC transporter permease [Eubacteriales bacterium]|nr:ABC transporter permease [Eubacteriales bacterium]